MFCNASGHTQEQCFTKECAAKAAKAKTKERKEEHKTKRRNGDRTAHAAATAAASIGSSSPPPLLPKDTKLALNASVCLAGTVDKHADAQWIADSGATSHMSTQHHWFKTFKLHVVTIRVANNAVVYSKGIGSIVMKPTNESLPLLLLSCVLYILLLQNNLLSVLHLVSASWFCVKIEGALMDFLHNGKRMFTATICENTAWLNVRTLQAPESALRGKAVLNCTLWHCRLGHIGKDALERAICNKLANGLCIDSDAPLPLHCEPCIVGKHHRDPSPAKALHRATRILEHIHSDVHMVPVPTVSGFRYWVTFIDDWSRYGWIWLLKKKSNVFEAFKAFKAYVELWYNAKIGCLHNDKGGKYIGHVWDAYFTECGI
jgi:hypothetical protein